jgi:putative transposase
MIDRKHKLSISRQAKTLAISRGSIYYLPRPVSMADLALMRRIDKLHLDYPFAGSRMLKGLLVGEGYKTGRLHVRTLMKRMGIEAIYRRPNTSKPASGHKIYPYLLRKLPVTRPNQAWAMDITYIPMARGFVYLAAVVDWFIRRVFSWRLSITLEVDFALKRSRKRLPGMASQTSSIPIRDRSLHPSTSSKYSGMQILPSQWTVRAHGVITSLSNGYGEQSNMKKSICMLTRMCRKPALLSVNI